MRDRVDSYVCVVVHDRYYMQRQSRSIDERKQDIRSVLQTTAQQCLSAQNDLARSTPLLTKTRSTECIVAAHASNSGQGHYCYAIDAVSFFAVFVWATVSQACANALREAQQLCLRASCDVIRVVEESAVGTRASPAQSSQTTQAGDLIELKAAINCFGNTKLYTSHDGITCTNN